MAYNIRGSKEWAIWHLKSIAIPRLLDDLDRHESNGYPEDRCNAVKSSLKQIIEISEARPASVWHPSVSDEFRQMRQIYDNWNNNLEGADLLHRMNRKTAIEEMRAIRGLIKRKIHKAAGEQQGDFATEEDLEIAREAYDVLDNLSATYPDVFKSLRKGVMAFQQAF